MAFDPLVAALAQLVRDRWAAEHPDSRSQVASGCDLSNMSGVGVQPPIAKDSDT